MNKKKFKKGVNKFESIRDYIFQIGINIFGGFGFVLGLMAIGLILEENTPNFIFTLAKIFGFFIGAYLGLFFISILLRGVLANPNNFKK